MKYDKIINCFINGDGKCRFNITKQEDREKIKAIIEGEI